MKNTMATNASEAFATSSLDQPPAVVWEWPQSIPHSSEEPPIFPPHGIVRNNKLCCVKE